MVQRWVLISFTVPFIVDLHLISWNLWFGIVTFNPSKSWLSWLDVTLIWRLDFWFISNHNQVCSHKKWDFFFLRCVLLLQVACKYLDESVLYYRKGVGWVKQDYRYCIYVKSVDPLEAYIHKVFWLRFGNKWVLLVKTWMLLILCFLHMDISNIYEGKAIWIYETAAIC